MDWRQLSHQSPAVYWDSEAFLDRVGSVLPRYRAIFQKACSHQRGINPREINWRLLAAIGYQESHWKPDAQSPTGVRGIMMLTQKTARELGVSDRVNPQQSIFGGARYLQALLNSLPQNMEPSSRLPMALAAYNMGPAYVMAARNITRRQGGDPNNWLHIQKRLVYMGKSRSQQALTFVNRTLRYYQLLNWIDMRKRASQDGLEIS